MSLSYREILDKVDFIKTLKVEGNKVSINNGELIVEYRFNQTARGVFRKLKNFLGIRLNNN